MVTAHYLLQKQRARKVTASQKELSQGGQQVAQLLLDLIWIGHCLGDFRSQSVAVSAPEAVNSDFNCPCGHLQFLRQIGVGVAGAIGAQSRFETIE